LSNYEVRHLDTMAATALAALAEGGLPGYPLIDKRILSVQATPEKGTSSDLAMGVAALPPGYSIPEHTHRAEEIAVIVRGSGTITIDDEPIEVSPGSVVVTPPHARHVTASAADEEMVVFWVYGPAGSESRWLERDVD